MFGLLLVWVVVSAPWWVKILAVVVGLALAAGYVLVTRGADDEDGADGADGDPPAAATDDTTQPAPPSEGTPA